MLDVAKLSTVKVVEQFDEKVQSQLIGGHMYPLRYPLSGFLGSLGVPLLVKVEITCDPEANVYVATSPDIDGLVVEAATLDEVKSEAMELIPILLAANKPSLHNRPTTDVSFRQHLFA